MNRFIKGLALLAIPLFASIAPAHAAVGDITLGTPTLKWSVGLTNGPTMAAGRSMAVSNGKIYVLGTDKKIYYADASGWKSFAVNGNKTVPCNIASDSQGNIVIVTGTGLGSIIHAFDLYTPGATSASNFVKTLTLATSSYPTGRADFISAAGDLNSASGGKIYIAETTTTSPINKQVRVLNVSKTFASYTTSYLDLPAAYGHTSTSYFKPNRNDASSFVYHSGGSTSANYILSLSGSTLSLVNNDKSMVGDHLAATTVGQGNKMFCIKPDLTISSSTITQTGFTITNVNKSSITKSVVLASGQQLKQSGTIYHQSAWCEAEMNAAGDKITAYFYQPGQGAWCYEIAVNEESRPNAPTNLQVSLPVNNTNQPNRIDAVFTWTASTTPGVTYSLQRYNGTDWVNVKAGITATTHTITDVTAANSYRVIAVANSAESDPSNTVEIDPPFLPQTAYWDGDPRTYDGYSSVQLRWTTFSYGHRPQCFDIYRDGALLAENVMVANYIDNYVPDGDHTYEIHSVYRYDNGERRPETAASAPKTITVAARNPLLNQYSIEEVYNYRIDDDNDGVFPYLNEKGHPSSYLDQQDIYRQGAFYKGYWYVFQREDHPTVGQGTQGGIVRFDANPGSIADMGNSATYVYRTLQNSSAGIAVDEHGNLFFRLKTNEASNYDYAQPVKKGRIVSLKDDLLTVKEVRDIDFGNALGDTRCDYYSMEGNVMGPEGGYIYFAPTSSNNVYRAHVVNGELDKVDTYTFNAASLGGTELYAFPLPGRHDIVYNRRSSGYYNIDFSKPGVANEMYTTFSRINNAGGISFWHNRRLFFVTPETPRSKNVGNFYVALAASPDGFGPQADSPETCLIDKANLMPLLTFSQTDIDAYAAEYSSANGNWFGCEEVPAEEDLDGYGGFYIYQYVPGMRFAKYRVYTTYQLPNTKVDYKSKVRYQLDSEGKPVDILAIDGEASWDAVDDHSDDVGSAYRRLHRYILELTNRSGHVFETLYFDGAGNPRNSTEIEPDEATVPVTPITSGKITAQVPNIDHNNVTARVTVMFRNLNTNKTAIADPVWATHSTNYVSKPATETKVHVYNGLWQDWVDEQVVDKPVYRIDIDFQAPQFKDGEAEPISHYRVQALKPGATEWVNLEQLHYTSQSAAQRHHSSRKNLDGNPEITYINGQYDFGDRAPAIPGSGDPVAVVTQYVTDSDPMGWKFRVVTAYAASHTPEREGFSTIAREEYSSVAPLDNGFTGVDNINSDHAAEPQYFTLQGIRVANPVKGQLYIVRRGASVTKQLF